MNMSLFFGLESENSNIENDSMNLLVDDQPDPDEDFADGHNKEDTEPQSQAEKNENELNSNGIAQSNIDDPAEATETFICKSLGISSDELDYYSSEEYRENQVQSLEIGRLKGWADDKGITKAGRDMNGGEFIKGMRDKNTLLIHHISRKFKSLGEAINSSEVKRYIKEASKWRQKKGYRVVKPAEAIKAEPITFDNKNLRSIDGETIYISRRSNVSALKGTAYETYVFELKIVYVKNNDPNAEIKGVGKTMAGTFGASLASIGKNKIKTKGFCAVLCQLDDQSIRTKNPLARGIYC